MTYRNRFFISVALVGMLATTISGCSDEVTLVVPEPAPGTTNVNSPNANNRILAQSTLGDPARANGLVAMEPDGSGGFYVIGLINGGWGVGRLDDTGGLAWFKPTPCTPRDLLPMSLAGSTVIMVASACNLDLDQNSEEGRVTTYNSGGSMLGEVAYARGAGDVWVNSLTTLTDSTVLIVGGTRVATETQPYYAVVSVGAAGQLTKQGEAPIPALSGLVLDNVAINPADVTASDVTFYATGAPGNAAAPRRVIFSALKAPLSDLSSVTVETSFDIDASITEQMWLQGGSALLRHNDRFYVAGYAALAKGNPPLPNRWSSGFVACIPATGTGWTRYQALSQFDDGYDNIRVVGGALFASGIYSSYIQQVSTIATFSYGLISKLDLTTGAVLFDFYFGDAAVSSAALGVWVANDVAQFVGITGQRTTFGGSRAWFVEANVGGSPTRSLGVTVPEAKSVHALPRGLLPFGASKY